MIIDFVIGIRLERIGYYREIIKVEFYDSIDVFIKYRIFDIFILGVDYIHGEVMYGHTHGLYHEVGQQREDMVRNYEAHIFVGQTKHVSSSC